MELSRCGSKHAFEKDNGNNGTAVRILHERSLRGPDSYVLRSDTYEKNRCLNPNVFSSIVDKTFHNYDQKTL